LSAAHAQSPEEIKDMRSVAPPRAQAVYWKERPAAPSSLDPKTALKEPKALIRFFEANPKRITVENMNHPDIAKTLAQVFLKADRTFMAERLLGLAAEKWPDDIAIRRAHGRVLMSLGQPAAREVLRKVIADAPTDPTTKYLMGMALLRIEPRTAQGTQEAIALFEKVLELDPNYTDADGVGPRDLRGVIGRLKGGDRRPPAGH
jgi:tetratricopeptide (TPR) repeat protein